MSNHTGKRKPGPEAEKLQIPGDWTDAVKIALKRGKPPAKKGAKKKKTQPRK